jgi:hypothetical protein
MNWQPGTLGHTSHGRRAQDLRKALCTPGLNKPQYCVISSTYDLCHSSVPCCPANASLTRLAPQYLFVAEELMEEHKAKAARQGGRPWRPGGCLLPLYRTPWPQESGFFLHFARCGSPFCQAGRCSFPVSPSDVVRVGRRKSPIIRCRGPS